MQHLRSVISKFIKCVNTHTLCTYKILNYILNFFSLNCMNFLSLDFFRAKQVILFKKIKQIWFVVIFLSYIYEIILNVYTYMNKGIKLYQYNVIFIDPTVIDYLYQNLWDLNKQWVYWLKKQQQWVYNQIDLI